MKSLLVLLIINGLAATSAQAIINGLPAAAPHFAAVGSLYINNEQSCTVTLINAKWIVTADHCAHATIDSGEEGGGPPLPPSSYEIRFGEDSKNPVFKTGLKKWVHGSQNGDANLDMAFGELKTVIPSQLKITPVPFAAANAALPAQAIGFGNRSFFDDGLHPLRFRRQLAQMQIKSVSGNALLNLFENEAALNDYVRTHQKDIDLEEESLDQLLHRAELIENYQVHAWDNRGRSNLNRIVPPTEGWADTCFGDSGGPLVQIQNKKLVVVGVTSTGLNRTCATLGTVFTVFGPKLQKIAKSLK